MNYWSGWNWIWDWDWNWHGDWNWAWGGFLIGGAIFGLVIGLLIEILFLLNLRNTLQRVSEQNRAMPPNHVWLNLIPVFGLGWFIYTVVRIKDSLGAEYRARGWAPGGDQGHSVGLAAGVLAIVSFVFSWGVPLLGFVGAAVGIARLVCWIIYWVKIAQIKNRLGLEAPVWGGPAASPPYSGYVPPAPGTDAPAVDSAGSSGKHKICAVCGTAVGPGDKFCRVCGLPLPQDPSERTS